MNLELTYKTDTTSFHSLDAVPEAQGTPEYTYVDTPYSRIAVPPKPIKSALASEKLPAPPQVPIGEINPLSQPITDNLSLSLLHKDGVQCDMTVSCELMTNATAATPGRSTDPSAALESEIGCSIAKRVSQWPQTQNSRC